MRTIVLGDQGAGFGVECVKRGVVWIQHGDGNIPISRAFGGIVQESFIVGDPAFLFIRVEKWFEVFSKILPKDICHARLDVDVGDAPYRANVVVGALGKGRRDNEKADGQNNEQRNFPHVSS